MGFISEFKEFTVKGNVMDMAVGIIIGAAFGSIVNSLVKDVLMPPIGMITGGINFADLFYALDGKSYATLAEAQAKVEETQTIVQQAKALQAEKESLERSLKESQATIETLRQQAQGQVKPAISGPAQLRAEDKDQDGVSDAIDLCPDSPPGSAVDALGCPSRNGFILSKVNFATGTADLTAESKKQLDQTAVVLGQAPHLLIEVAGYTDNVGDAQRNKNLSGQRAQAVVNYLISKGIATDRLTAKGYGTENPIASNATAEGRQKNRRIELHPKTH